MIRKDRRTGKNRCQEPQLIPQTLTGTRAFKALYALDKQITRNINKSEIETRPVESNGLWCCVLIPAVLISHSLLYPVSPLYKLIAFLSFGLFCYSLLFSLFLYMSCLILYTNLNAGCTVSTLVATLPIYVYTDFGLALALALSVMVILPYSSLLKALLVRFPRTFTVGEAMIISQAIVLFSVTGVIVYYTELFMPDLLPKDDEITFILIYVYTVLSTVGLIVTALYFLHEEDRTVKVLGLLVGAGAIFALIVLHLCLGFTALPEFIYYIFMDSVRWRLFTFWAILLMASAIAVVFHTRGEKASMSDRKTYHVFGTLVFVTGILYDVPFMTLAAGVTSGLIILIEALRLSRIDPISSALQAAFDTYCDEKDCGLLAVTPMYLYFGLSCPLALVPWGGRGGAVQLELLSGVLAIGVGDTAACWLGSRYGVNYWPGSSRTMEGTAANAVVQIIFVYFLHLFEWMNAPYWFLRTAVAAIVTALVEAQVEQVDNLVLPLFSLLAFHATAFLAY